MKKALIHDWYYVNGGAEKVVHSINNIWNDFSHYALIDFLNKDDRKFILNGSKVKTSFIQKLPTAKNDHRKFLQLFPYAIERFNLNDFDLIISSSSSIAKGVIVNKNQLHICYCHSPMRYAWDLYHQYLDDLNLNSGLKANYVKWVLNKLRKWDLASNRNVDYFVANSNFIAERIKRLYNRDSVVIYPPVDIDRFQLKINKEDYYLAASRLVPYKKISLIVEAFNNMPQKELVVVGDGPEMNRIKKLAKNNIKILGELSFEELKKHMQNAKALVYAAEEDFGIIPVEAQACGTPVIAYGKGGCVETVLENITGIFFSNQSTNDIIQCVNKFEKLSFNSEEIRINAERFSKERFEYEFRNFVEDKLNEKILEKKIL